MPFTTHSDNPLMGKIICAECGHTFLRKKNYKDSYKWICNGVHRGDTLCRNGQISKKATEDIDKIEKILVRPGKKLSIVFKDGRAMDVSCDDVSSRHS